MKEQIALLVELQKIDSEIRGLVLKKKELPERCLRLDEEFRVFSEKMEEERSRFDLSVKAHRDKEQEFKDGQEKLRKTKERLLEVKTNKEYQAMLKEIESIEQKNSGIEEEILSLLERMDSLRKELKHSEEVSQDRRQAYERQRSQIEKEISTLDREILGHQKALQTLSRKIDSTLAKRYEMIKGRKNGLAVVSVVRGVCSGCHMNVPPQLCNELQRSDSFLTCPYCNRILFWEERADDE